MNSTTPDVKHPAKLLVVDKLRMLLDITKTISRSLDLDDVLKRVMQTLGTLLPHDAAGIYLIEQDDKNERHFVPKVIQGYDPDFTAELPRLKFGEGFLSWVAEHGESLISPDVSKDKRYFSARKRTRSEMLAPIISNETVIGVFDLESDESDAFDDDDLEVLKLLASQVAIIIEKANLYEQQVEQKRIQAQLEVARQLQLALLPGEDPQLAGFDISAYNFSTEEISGDYYDWVKIFDDQIGIVVADAVGKGIPAALLMAFLRASLRAAVQTGYAPHIALSKLNDLLWESTDDNKYMTVIYGILDATNRTFVYSNAGHCPPLLVHSNGEFRFIEYGDIPLGLFPEQRFHQHFIRLEKGQTLVFYTDGITEAANKHGEEFGNDKLVKSVKDSVHLPAREMIDFIRKSVADFTERKFLDDDGTLFIIKAQ